MTINSFLFVISAILTLTFSQFNRNQQAYVVLDEIEYMDALGKPTLVNNYVNVVYTGDYAILLHPYFRKNGNATTARFPIIDEIKSDTLYSAYISKKGLKQGLKLDSIGAARGQVKNVDSILNNERSLPTRLLEYMIRNKDASTLQSTHPNGDFMEYITIKNNTNEKDPDSAILYYCTAPMLFSFRNESKITKKCFYKAEFFYRLAKKTKNTRYLNKVSFEVRPAEISQTNIKSLVKKFEDNLSLVN